MKQLPLIIGFGGINCAGRSSGYHAFHRLIFDELDNTGQANTLKSLGALMSTCDNNKILKNTLIRELDHSWYQRHASEVNQAVKIDKSQICLSNHKLPNPVPMHWKLIAKNTRTSTFIIDEPSDALLATPLHMETKAAGCLPLGFNPANLYSSKNHPRSLQMALFALSDCLGNSGLDWSHIQSILPPDQISVYAGSSFGQFDTYGIGGLLKSNVQAKRPTARQIPLGYSQAPADFANAYVLGNLGSTGASLGACASFLYNLRNACDDIRNNRCQIAIAGASEAPLIPELINGFQVMGALCSDDNLRKLDNLDQDAILDYSRACRPFGENNGFVMSEAAQFFLLASPAFAGQIGAQIFGAVGDVFINADGYKKSISSTGAGNSISLAKATASLRSMLGDSALQQRSLVLAHGTGTPLNRVTESYILNQIAQAFTIPAWKVSAVKGLIGHSQGAAAADQLSVALGIWQDNWLPGITTTEIVADDVCQTNLDILLQPRQALIDAVLINAKGFGGNNGTGLILSDRVGIKAMQKLLSKIDYDNWLAAQQATREQAHLHDQKASQGEFNFRYLYDHQVILEKDIHIDQHSVRLPGHQPVLFQHKHPYGDIF